MPNPNYLSGVRKERKLVNSSRDKGMIAFRSAGSHSPFDVFILDYSSKTIRLIQCKPKSMSEKAKDKLSHILKLIEGDYKVEVSVE